MAERVDDPEVLRRLLDELPTLTMLVSPEGEIRWASQAVARIFGRSVDEVVGSNILEHIDPEWDPYAFDSIGAAIEAEGLRLPILFRVLIPDGGKAICEVWASSQIHDPVLGGMVVTVRRWDERVLLDRALETIAAGDPVAETLRLLVGVLGTETLEGEGALLYRPDGRAFTEIVATHGLSPLLSGELDDPDGPAPWTTVLTSGERVALGLDDLPPALRGAARAAGFGLVWAWPVTDPSSGAIDACAVVWRRSDEVPPDHSRVLLLDFVARIAALALDRERTQQRLEYAAMHDPLTALANRGRFYTELERATRRADGAADDALVGVLYLDLDGFKPVNDRLGHGAGDRILEVVAERLRSTVRGDDLVARVGGDEFAVLCAGVTDRGELERLAERLVRAIADPVVIGGERVTVGASVGIGLARPGETTADVLVEAADGALYEAKAAGKGGWRLTVADAG